MQINPNLCGVVSLSLDEGCSLQIVVPAGPERALEEGATLDSCLDLGQREVLRKQHLTAGDLILKRRNNVNDCPKFPVGQYKASLQCMHSYLCYLVIFRQRQTIHQFRIRYKTFDVLLT